MDKSSEKIAMFYEFLRQDELREQEKERKKSMSGFGSQSASDEEPYLS
jgi:hypothetical protein